MNNKAIFITGTGTEVGKTYVTALILKKLREDGINAGYYKAAMSGNQGEESDAEYIKRISGIHEKTEEMVSFSYDIPVSPHLASEIKGNSVCMKKIKTDFENISNKYEFTCVEGSGGIICPLKLSNNEKILLPDVIKKLELNVIIVADAGLGTINNVYLTVYYCKNTGINVKGIILNNYDSNSIMHKDNKKVIEELTGINVIALVKKDAENIDICMDNLK